MQLVRKQRIIFTLATTLIAAVFLALLLGGFFGIICIANDSYMSSALDKALVAPNAYNETAPQNLKCFFVYVNIAENFCVIKDDISYLEDCKEDLAKQAASFPTGKAGKFKCGGHYFICNSAEHGDFKVIAVIDRTGYRSQLLNTGLLTVLLYCCSVGLAALIAYLLSAKLLQPVADAMSKQRDLTANASHELKTPLTVIAANLSVIKSEPETTVADNIHWIESIDTQIVRMQDLITNMLELSKLEQSVLPFEQLDFSSVCEGACLSFEPVCFEKGVDIVTTITPGLNVLGDKRALERLVVILLDNAVKYCSENGKVGLKLTGDKKRVRLSVMNTGESVTKEEATHVFDRFYRTDGARQNEDNKSFGLGLSIAYATAQAHGGAITCRGVEGKGTVFTVILPPYKPSRRQRKRKAAAKE